MLIEKLIVQNILHQHRTTDYCFAKYHTYEGKEVVSLLRYISGNYYDIVNLDYVNRYNVVYVRDLTDYVDYDKRHITDKKAKKLALPYYDEFVNTCHVNDLDIRA